MTKYCYVPYNPRAKARKIIEICNTIITEYTDAGFDLTLRQLYYQLVARDKIPNTQKSYSNLGVIVNKARLGGLISWDAIVDRTRTVYSKSHWENPHEILYTAWKSYFVDMWKDQRYRPEVWIEKDALRGVISGICTELDVPYFACRGYVSQSVMWRSALRAIECNKNGQQLIIVHLGDHDPSGIDMTRDIEDRIRLLGSNASFQMRRIALNMDQVDEYGPPPNPAKVTDSRFETYQSEFGDDSWELDALDPRTIIELIKEEIRSMIDPSVRNQQVMKLEEDQAYLERVYDDAINN